ncbi:glycosyltransferase family 4 protein [Pseudalkalibacillus sp. Hm43]|uniref:glycosyltransferase family 4 protein n=1 Tax=Pseudalkalibacillus sp. Hm43 TaxID=3450742 RepID=UPI003F422D0B
MKIALIATEKLPVPAIRGGAIQIYIESVAPIMAKRHEVTVYSIQDPKLPHKENVQGVQYVRFESENFLDGIIQHMKEERHDVVHVCNRPHWINILHDKVPGPKYILSVHNEMFADGKIEPEDGERCISTVSRIVTVSDFIGRTITERFPSADGKVKTVYSGVDLDSYHPKWTSEGRKIRNRMRESLGIEGKNVILFVGRLSKVKGPHILIQSLPEIIKQHPDTYLVFVGSKWFGDDFVNNYVKYLYRLGTLHMDNVKFIKFVEPSDIPNYYSMADVFVCCSQWREPLARVHYEAMAAGLPIITTNRGGNKEVIQTGGNGYAIDNFDDPFEYSKHINKLLDSRSLCEKIGKKGRSIAEESFGFERVARQLQQVYGNA